MKISIFRYIASNQPYVLDSLSPDIYFLLNLHRLVNVLSFLILFYSQLDFGARMPMRITDHMVDIHDFIDLIG